MPAPPCLFCLRRISKAVTCDNCHRWHHIRCGDTGISSEMYDAAVLNGLELQFTCRRCIDMDVDENGDISEEQLDETHIYSEVEEVSMDVNTDATSCSNTEIDSSAILMASFDISHRNTDDPQPITEESLVANPDDTVLDESEDLSRARTARSLRLDRRLKELWSQYQDSDISTTSFFKSCSAMYSPSVLT